MLDDELWLGEIAPSFGTDEGSSNDSESGIGGMVTSSLEVGSIIAPGGGGAKSRGSSSNWMGAGGL